MTMNRLSTVAYLAACLATILPLCPVNAQSDRDGTRLQTSDLLAVQLYAVGGGFIPFATSLSVASIDLAPPTDNVLLPNRSGPTSSVTPLVGARVHVPMFWYLRDEQRLGFSIFFETGFQSGLAAQSLLQTFNNTSPSAMDYGSSTIREYWQIPLLLGVTVPVGGDAAGPRALFDFYGGLTLDSWNHVLQGAEANAPGAEGFFGQSRRLTADPTVGLGIRVPVGSIDSLPLFLGVNAEAQFRPGNVVSAFSSNFPVAYSATVDPYANLAVMARVGISFGGR